MSEDIIKDVKSERWYNVQQIVIGRIERLMELRENERMNGDTLNIVAIAAQETW